MTELMSPCGNFETLLAAIKAGCDSVYFGVKELNMRTGRAKNFELKDLNKIKKICAENNIRCYITLNSIVYDNELDNVDNILNEVKKAKIDAVIASDWSVILKARKKGVAVHISTQQSCCNIEALKHFSKFADMIVLARELSLEQIKAIKERIVKEKIKGPSNKLIKIEAFCHGAMCISVSGRCFMSQFVYGCSANRGKCLQNCRREYEVFCYDDEYCGNENYANEKKNADKCINDGKEYIIKDTEEGHELKLGKGYVMSPKDICTLKILDKLMSYIDKDDNRIIDVLKIEGRGRSVDYIYTVTKVYRTAIDLIKKNNYNEKNKKKLMTQVKKVYNRGFSNGFYMGVPLNEWSKAYGSKAAQRKVYVGKVINYFGKTKVAEILIEAGEKEVVLKKGSKIVFTGETTGYVECDINEMLNSSNNKPIKSTKQGQKITVKVDSLKNNEKLRKNNKVFAVINSKI
ncbi:MAG: peptidase U32 family protein [Candidatus Woesearchaeota archaeon]